MPKQIKLYGQWRTVAGFDYALQAYWIVTGWQAGSAVGCSIPINHYMIKGAR